MPKSSHKTKNHSMINKIVVNVNSYNKKSKSGGGGAGGSKAALPLSSVPSISNVTYPTPNNNYYNPFHDAIQEKLKTLEPPPIGIKQPNRQPIKQPYYLHNPVDINNFPDDLSELSSMENSYNELENSTQLNKLKQNFLVNYAEHKENQSPLTSYNLSRAASELELGKQNSKASENLFKPLSLDLNSNNSIYSNPSIHLSDLQSLSSSNKTINLDPSQINYNYGMTQEPNNETEPELQLTNPLQRSSLINNNDSLMENMSRFYGFLQNEKTKDLDNSRLIEDKPEKKKESQLLLDHIPENVEIMRPKYSDEFLHSILMNEPFINNETIDNKSLRSLHYNNYSDKQLVPYTDNPITKQKLDEQRLERYNKLQSQFNQNQPPIKLKEIKTIDNIDQFINKISDKIIDNPNYILTKQEKKELGQIYKTDLMGKKMTGNLKYGTTALLEIVKHKNEIDEKKEIIKAENKKKEEAIKKDKLIRFPVKKNTPKRIENLAGGAVEVTSRQSPGKIKVKKR